MSRASLALVLVLMFTAALSLNLASPAPRPAPPEPLVCTFSIVAYDPDKQEWGVAVASKYLAVGAVVPWAKVTDGSNNEATRARLIVNLFLPMRMRSSFEV